MQSESIPAQPGNVGNPAKDRVLPLNLQISGVRVATGTMVYKHTEVPLEAASKGFELPNYALKSIPHVDGNPSKEFVTS